MTGFWFFDDLPRVALEREEIQSLAESVEWFKDPVWRLQGSGLVLEATIEVHGQAFPIRMTYPAMFPAQPPAVRPQEDDVRWSGHQYGDGTLCLEWGPDTWRPEITGRQMVESAHALLQIEKAAVEGKPRVAPSRHQLSLGQSTRSQWARMYVSNALRAKLLSVGDDGGEVRLSYHFQHKSHSIVIESIETGGETWTNEEVPPTLRHKPDSFWLEHAILVRLAVDEAEMKAISTVEALDTLLAAHGKETLSAAQSRVNVKEPMSAIVVDRQGQLHFLLRYSADSPDLRSPGILRPTAAAGARSSPEFSALAGKSVAIVGLGSVGSKMAESLARSGVGRFMLVDHDVFLPENVVRNGLDLHNSCELKVHAVAQRLTKISPSVKVDYSTVHLVGQESNAAVASAVRRIGQCDVIIDATANPRVFTLLAHLVVAKEKPLVWMEVFGGNLGGLIARSRQSKDASPFVVRDIYAAYTRDHPFDEKVEFENYDAIVDGRVVVASDAQVSVVAGYAVQFALDSLLEREPSRFLHCLYLIGMERRWVFDAPMHTIAIETPPPSAKADEVGDADANAKTIEFLASLLGGPSGEAAATP